MIFYAYRDDMTLHTIRKYRVMTSKNTGIWNTNVKQKSPYFHESRSPNYFHVSRSQENTILQCDQRMYDSIQGRDKSTVLTLNNGKP